MHPAEELGPSTIGIVGLGTIGKKVARLARAFGMDVQYYDIQRLSEDALVEALTNRTIAGAGLDVFEPEPSPVDNPLFKLKNVVLSPHLAGPIWDAQYQKFRNAFDNIQRVGRGERPLWLIPELAGWKLRIDV